MRRVLVCGSRDWYDIQPILWALVGIRERTGPIIVVHGAARGADELAGQLCRSLGFTEEPHPADWRGHGRSAGPIRNQLMLSLGADYVLAFKDNFDHTLARGGTEHMVKIARAAGVRTFVTSH